MNMKIIMLVRIILIMNIKNINTYNEKINNQNNNNNDDDTNNDDIEI